jgi:hypothetical protein
MRKVGALAVACCVTVAGLVVTSTPAAALDPMTGYLMVHFTGESASGEQIYFATSSDGLHWEDLNNGQPVLLSDVGEEGVRDPAVIRSVDGSKFWILATDLRIASGKGWTAAQHDGSTKLVVWESTNLVDWSPARLVDVAGSIPDAGCAWAPEAIWDPNSNAYIVYWATISPLNGVTKPRIYYSKTTDFRTFTPAQMYIDRPGSQGIIDTQAIEVPGSVGGYKYVRASGDGQITFEGSQSVLGNWTRIGDISHLGLTGSQVEGPILHQFNGRNEWGLYVDQYSSGKGYLPLVSTNMGSTQNWRIRSGSEYDLGSNKKRHGSIMSITSAEMNRIQAQWGASTPINRLQSKNYPDRYIRHANWDALLESNVNPFADSQFRLVPGLADNSGYVSFASVNFPGYYLRHKDFDFVLEPYSGGGTFAADATFKEVAGLGDSAMSSFQSINYPSRYIRHYNFELKLDPISSTSSTTAKQDATFAVTG